MIIRTAVILLSVALAFIAPPASALEVQSSIATRVTFRTCLPIQSTCDYFEMTALGTFSGEPGALEAVASQAIAGYGESYASGSFSGEAGAPILKARAAAELGKRVSANVYALQRFTYTGDKTTQRTFEGTLTYSLENNNPEDAGSIGESVVNTAIHVFKLESLAFEAGSTAEQNMKSLFELTWVPLDGYELLAYDRWEDGVTNSAGEATLAATVTLEPGDAVWVLAKIQTPAASGSAVDASRTFVTRWTDSTDLIPANVSPGIPEELLAELLENSTGVGPGSSLAAKARNAQAYYAAGDVSSTCGMLGDYQNQVSAVSGQRLEPDLATKLSADAQKAQLAIGCQ